MLKLYESTPGTNIMSLRIGGPIASVIGPIINPNNLYIEGWHVEDNRSGHRLILLSNDVRDVLPQGFAVNDHEVLIEPTELVRLRDVLEMNFDLLGLKVNSQSGKGYGKVNDYAFETSNMYIQKIYASHSLVKIGGGNTSIDRSQIVEVTNKRIVIEDPTEKVGAPASASVVG